MTIPEPFSTGTVVGGWVTGTGAPARGLVIFTPRAPALISDDTIMLPSPRVAQLVDGLLYDGDTPNIELPATDDPDISPTGWTWKVELRISGLDIPPFDIPLPAGSTVNLASVVGVDADAGTTVIVVPGVTFFSDDPPENPQDGWQWWNRDTGSMFLRLDGAWIEENEGLAALVAEKIGWSDISGTGTRSVLLTHPDIAGIASGIEATSVGPDAVASGDRSTAVGRSAEAQGDRSLALGYAATAPNDGDVSISGLFTGNVGADGVTPTEAAVETGFLDYPVTADATNPAAGRWRLVARSDGIHARDDAGSEVGPIGASGFQAPSLLPGAYYTMAPGPLTDTAVLREREWSMPLDLRVPCSVDGIGILTIGTAASAGGVVRAGIRADDGFGSPGALLVDGGTAPADTTSTFCFVTFASPVALTARRWHLVVAIQNSSVDPVLRCAASVGRSWIGKVAVPVRNNSDIMTGYRSSDPVTGAFTETETAFGSGFTLATSIPAIWFRVA